VNSSLSMGFVAILGISIKRSLTPRLTGKNAEHFCPR
jgi:hypothetical protein